MFPTLSQSNDPVSEAGECRSEDNMTPHDSVRQHDSSRRHWSNHEHHSDVVVVAVMTPEDGATSDLQLDLGSSDTTQLIGSCETGHRSPGISEYSAVFLIINAALGAGLLNFPLAFHQSGGLVPGNLVHLFFVCATVGSLYIMAHTASQFGSRTYQQMVTQQCGDLAGHMTSACIAVYCLITCVTFLIIVGDQTDRFFADLFGPHFCDTWAFNRSFTMLVAGVMVLALSLFKDMAKLVTMGYIGSVFMLYLLVVIVWEWAYGGYTPGRVLVYDTQQAAQVFDVLPTISFGYQCHVSSVPIYHSIRGRTKAKYFKACTISMLCCAAFYSIAANFGYLTFGSKVTSDLLLSYDSDHRGAVAVSIAVITLALKSVATYPLLMYCVREAVVSFYVSGRRLSAVEADRTEARRRYVVVLLLWAASLGAAMMATNIDVVVRLLGSLAAFFIFVIPGLCLFVHCNELEDCAAGAASWRVLAARATGACYVVLGVFTFGLSVSLAWESLLTPADASNAPLCVVSSNATMAGLANSRHRLMSLPL